LRRRISFAKIELASKLPFTGTRFLQDAVVAAMSEPL
jgi:hypothetical protein